MKFRTAYTRDTALASRPGNADYTWLAQENKKNCRELTEHTMNIQDKISSFKTSCDYKKLLSQGGTLENGNNLFLDTTKLPTNFASASDLLTRSRELIAELSNAQRGKDSGEGSKSTQQISTETSEEGGTAVTAS